MIRLYEVGGCVRDSLLGIPSKDIDFAVEITPYTMDPGVAWGYMIEWLKIGGYEIFLESPDYFTVRARFPRDFVKYPNVTADFVMCRTEGPYTDGRRPDWVQLGTIYDDLSRRDFTVNAIARTFEGGELLDPHEGRKDLQIGKLACVGRAEDRLREDALRALRALRFIITKNLQPDNELWMALCSTWLPPLLASVSVERRREELLKMFKTDTTATIRLLSRTTPMLWDATFAHGLWLRPTLET